MIYNGINKPPLGIKLNRAHRSSKGLVGCWLFNEGCGKKVYDHSGYGHHGTLNGMAFPATATSGWNPGRKGVVLRFDGDNDYINCGNDPSLNITDAITMEAWVKANNLVGGHAIADKQKAMLDYTQPWRWGLSGSSVGLQMGGGGTTFNNWSFGTITLDNWHHIGFTIEGTSVKGYIDGIQAGSTETFVGTRQSSNLALLIGRRKDGDAFSGSIDGVKIYDRGLTASEISQLYRTPFCMFEIDDSWVLQAGKSKLPIGANIAAAKLLL